MPDNQQPSARFYLRTAADLNLDDTWVLPFLVYEKIETHGQLVCACPSEAQAQRILDALKAADERTTNHA